MTPVFINTRLSRILTASLTIAVLAVTVGSAQQQSEFMMTWKSDNYAPPSYQGKILPVDGSKIDVALELIDGGKIANLSGLQINWLINNDELKSGIGLKNISFTANGRRGDQLVEVTIKNYKGVDLEKRLDIPLTDPELVIIGGPTIFEVFPYFFNVKNINELIISWSANGRPTSGSVESPTALEVDTSSFPTNSEIVIQATASNSKKATEIASKTIIFKK